MAEDKKQPQGMGEPTQVASIQRLLKAVFGNGHPGMDEQIRALRKDVDGLMEMHKKLNDIDDSMKEVKTFVRGRQKIEYIVLFGIVSLAIKALWDVIVSAAANGGS